MITITVVFGQEAVRKICNNEQLNTSELELFQKQFSFETQNEADAFIKGLNAAVGWQEIYLFDQIQH